MKLKTQSVWHWKKYKLKGEIKQMDDELKEKTLSEKIRDKADQWFLPCITWACMAIIIIPWIVGAVNIIRWAF